MNMKKIILLALVLVFQVISAQITLTRLNLVPIANNSVLASTELGYPSEIGFKVKNIGSSTTNVWVKCESLLNNNGTNFELCFGEECLDGVSVGQVYPSVAVTLMPNASNGNFDHFLNLNPGTGSPVDFVFRFFQTNQNTQGGAEVGNTVTVTYRYDPNLSVDEISQLEKSGAIIKSTIVKEELVIDVLKKVTVSIFDINGKSVESAELNYGVHTLNASHWSAGIYIVNFTSEEGTISTKKIVKE